MNRKEKTVLLFLVGLLLAGITITYVRQRAEQRRLARVEFESLPAAAPVRLDLNAASQQELESLVGIGPALAARIIERRRAHGNFKAVSDLLRVKGIGKKKLALFSEQVEVGH